MGPEQGDGERRCPSFPQGAPLILFLEARPLGPRGDVASTEGIGTHVPGIRLLVLVPGIEPGPPVRPAGWSAWLSGRVARIGRGGGALLMHIACSFNQRREARRMRGETVF